jgi:DNA-binding response OmpR family regulator
MLPDTSGEDLCRKIRAGGAGAARSDIPIIMLTAKTDERSIIAGLNMGADDYVTKPFSLRELTARIGAILRRSAAAESGRLIILADLAIDTALRRVSRRRSADCAEGAEERIDLTYNEYRILVLLSSRPHKIFTRNEIIDRIKGDDFDGFDRAIDTHIKNLRQKIGDDIRHPKYIETVYGMGYRCAAESAAPAPYKETP